MVKNAEVGQDGINRQRSAQGVGAAANQWPTAEDEKLNLYEQARANVAKVQGVAASPVCHNFSSFSFPFFRGQMCD